MMIVSNLVLHCSPTIDGCVHVLYVVNGRNAMAAQKCIHFNTINDDDDTNITDTCIIIWSIDTDHVHFNIINDDNDTNITDVII